MSFSFIHLADIHLGRPFSGLSEIFSVEKDFECFQSALNKSLENLLFFSIEKKVDFILISGDTFDSSESDFSSVYSFKKLLKKFEENGIKVFVVCGNHDPIKAYNRNTFDFDENSLIKIVGVNTPSKAKIPFYKNGEIIGYIHSVSFEEEKFNGRVLDNFYDINTNFFNIALLHCDIEASIDSSYAPCLLSELKNFNFDYCALGHIHTPKKLSENIYYAGTLQGRNIKENGEHGIRYVCVENNKIVKNDFITMDVVRYENIEIDLSNTNDETTALDKVIECVNSFLKVQNHLCAVYLLSLKLIGTIDFYTKINEEFYKEVSEVLNSISIAQIYVSQVDNLLIPKVNENELLLDEGISGELYRIINDDHELKQIYLKTFQEIEKACIGNLNEEQILRLVKEDCKNLSNFIFNNEKED